MEGVRPKGDCDMPKPRTAAREQRRGARDLARRHAIGAVEDLLTTIPPALAHRAAAAYDAELRRIVERMRFQYRLRAEPAHSPTLARGDNGTTASPSDAKPAPDGA